ncbi:MAG: shikimate dehydrogenase [bacterium]|nr:shikimate dehydrogenase [bacterium]
MEINGETILTGVFGYPVKHSLSPVFQNAAFRFYGLNWVYIPFEVGPENLKTAIDCIRIFSIKGVNITIPHKRETVKYLDFCDEEVKVLQVCNTIVNENGVLKGYTTDGPGFLRSLKEDGKFAPENKVVFLFGAGGSAYAIAGALVRSGISEIFICNRTEEKAKMMKEHLSGHFGFENIEVVPFEKRNDSSIWKKIDLVVNTTSVGMRYDDIMLVDPENLRQDIFVYDIVYNRETALVFYAKKKKLRFLDGCSMLIFQGAISFTLWTGLEAPIEAMKKAIDAFKIKRP